MEKLLNSHNHSKTEIDGLDITFLHIRSPHGDAVPLLMSSGSSEPSCWSRRTLNPPNSSPVSKSISGTTSSLGCRWSATCWPLRCRGAPGSS
ncbi:hypothetical protein GKO32_12725 [Amycolatopsis sp. RM579]|uniref:Epoxide hydrolase N-terminal domain-containing protein n=1 Tax=Amycolatopsis pithecellobii TaxID=664692 RepID=A0A6N7YSC3_9PSEU|nr:hypothetical protein [Amycolatopsis pithecellobii]